MPRITAKNICLVAINQSKLGTSTHTETCAVGGSLAQAGLMLGTAVRVSDHAFISLPRRGRWGWRRARNLARFRFRRGNGGYP